MRAMITIKMRRAFDRGVEVGKLEALTKKFNDETKAKQK